MKTFIFTFTFLFCLGLSNSSLARRVRSTTDGGWPSTGTWHSGHVPASGDTIEIQSGDTVTITSVISVTGTAMVIELKGTLLFDGGGAKLNMPTGSYVNVDSTGYLRSNCSCGGSSQIIKSGTAALWTRSMGDVAGPTVLTPTPLPIYVIHFSGNTDGPQQAQLHYELLIHGYLTEGIVFEQIQSNGVVKHISTLEALPGMVKGIIQVNAEVGTIYFQVRDLHGNILAKTTINVGEKLANLRMYPNPVEGQTVYLSNVSPDAQVNIFSMDGKLIPVNLQGNALTWHPQLPKGIYYVKVQEGQHIETHRMVIP